MFDTYFDRIVSFPGLTSGLFFNVCRYSGNLQEMETWCINMFLCILLIVKKFLLDVVSALITLLSINVSAMLCISEMEHEIDGAQGKFLSLL